jgi:D-3-phosphoglycerate dehydrogenase
MKRILANDGIDSLGKKLLEEAGFFVETQKAIEGHLAETINDGKFDVLLVRSATKVRHSLIDACPGLKLIGRAGVGLDNIDVAYAEGKGMKVINTPSASSQSVAELVFAHLYAGVRFLHQSNHEMRGKSDFAALKKAYAKGTELQGKTIGIIGFGRIGQATAKIAIGSGMKVLAFDPYIKSATLTLDLPMVQETVSAEIFTSSLEDLLKESDFVTLHVPGLINGKALIGSHELNMMKKGSAIVNAARGGVIDEDALLIALKNGHLKFAALDVFTNEPTPNEDLLKNNQISVSPHIGAATEEAQERIGKEMADLIIRFFNA